MKYNLFTSTVPQMLIRRDRRIAKINPRLDRLFRGSGCVPEDLHLEEILMERRPGEMQRCLETLANGYPDSMMGRLLIPGHTAETWWNINLIPLEEDLIHVLFMDASGFHSEIGTLEEERNAAEDATRSKSLFLANMSHEIRTPIHTVRSLAELLSETHLDEEQSEYASQIQFSAEALLGLINDILDFSKIEAGKLEIENIRYSFPDLMSGIMDMLSLEIYKRKLELFYEIDPRMPRMIEGDPTRIRQIMVNLLSNAMKFTHQGHISIGVKVEDFLEGKVRYRIQVSDTGIGIPEEKQSALFTSFQQVDPTTTRKYGGTGLGLSICQNLVALMGGRIGFDSSQGEGASFWFVLDSEIASGETDTQLDDWSKVLADREIILVSAYTPTIDILQRQLENLAANIHRAESGHAGLECLKTVNANASLPPVVLVDYQLGDMDGWQFASEVNSDKALNTVRLFLMRPPGGMQADSKMKLLNWFDGYLNKPLKLHDMLRQINDALTLSLDLEPVEDGDFVEISDGVNASANSVVGSVEDSDKNTAENTIEELEEVIPSVREFSRGKSAPQQSSETPVAGLNILIAEDHFVNQQLFQTILTKLGHGVTAAFNGIEVLSQYKPGAFDLIFMDMQMPEMDGLEATSRLRKLGALEPIVAVTANALVGEREKCLRSGMDDYMTKPFGKQDLVTMIKRWKGRKHYPEAGEEVEPIVPKPQVTQEHLINPEPTVKPEPIEQPVQKTADAAGIFLPEKAIQAFMGREDIVRRVVSEFVRRTGDQLDEMHRLIGEKRFSDSRIISHGIKGSGRNLSMKHLADVAARLEDANEAENLEDSRDILPQLRGAYDELVAYLGVIDWEISEEPDDDLG